MRGLSLAERNTPIAQNFVLYSVYFALAGGYHAGYGGGFVNGQRQLAIPAQKMQKAVRADEERTAFLPSISILSSRKR